MTDMTMKGTSVQRPRRPRAATVLKRLRLSDVVFHGLTRVAAFAVLVLLSGVIMALVIGAAPALSTFGLSFVSTEVWNPVTEQFGALAPIYGTLVTSAIAMLIAVPVGLDDRVLPHRALPAWSCAGRSASPSSCWPASPASSTASGACSSSRRSCRSTCSRC